MPVKTRLVLQWGSCNRHHKLKLVQRVARCFPAFCLLMCGVGAVSTFAQSSVDGIDARSNTTELAIQLGNVDPLVRKRSAEALARLAAVDQKKLVEMLNETGFSDIEYKNLTGGIAAIHTGLKI